MKKTVQIIIGALFLAYPLLVYFGLTNFSARFVGILLLVFAILRVLLITGKKAKRILLLAPLLIPVFFMALLTTYFNNKNFLLLTPVFINLGFLISFGITLVKKPSMAARFALVQEKKESEQLFSYCKKVTIAWVVFFVLNGSMSLITVLWGSFELWTIYNGLISYVLIGLLFAVEFTIRKIKKLD